MVQSGRMLGVFFAERARHPRRTCVGDGSFFFGALGGIGPRAGTLSKKAG